MNSKMITVESRAKITAVILPAVAVVPKILKKIAVKRSYAGG